MRQGKDSTSGTASGDLAQVKVTPLGGPVGQWTRVQGLGAVLRNLVCSKRDSSSLPSNGCRAAACSLGRGHCRRGGAGGVALTTKG
jgi:hypothetical protein